MSRVLISFRFTDGWHVMFFDADRKRSLLPRKAFFNSDEVMVEFIRRGNGPKTLEDRNILEMQMKRTFGEVTLELTPEQYAALHHRG